jgi:lysozyme family protein
MHAVRFEDLHEAVALIEGGYVYDPDDRGGETYNGIARRWWPNWKGWTLLDGLKDQAGLLDESGIDREIQRSLDLNVRAFYREHFWIGLGINGFAARYEPLVYEVYETAVNVGRNTAGIWLQEALVCLGNPLIVIDGRIGPKTKEAVDRLSANDMWRAVQTINNLQGAHYVHLVLRDDSQAKFYKGWLGRTRSRWDPSA